MNKNYSNWNEIIDDEQESIWKKIGMVLFMILFVVIIWFCISVAGAYEEHRLCMNGATEYCIPEDFK